MKYLFLLMAILTSFLADAQNNEGDTALLIIDIQYFYYPGGKMELENPKPAGENAAKLLAAFRKKGKTIIHVRHNFEPGGDIYEDVKPIENEKVISKNYANSFRETDLQEFLKKNEIETLIICGMQTHMCVEAATRAAADLNYNCLVVHDACATRNLKFEGKEIAAEDVHYSTLNSLQGYAKIQSTAEFLKSFNK
jgi:nicotinamidase-related amidase